MINQCRVNGSKIGVVDVVVLYQVQFGTPSIFPNEVKIEAGMLWPQQCLKNNLLNFNFKRVEIMKFLTFFYYCNIFLTRYGGQFVMQYIIKIQLKTSCPNKK